MIHVLFALYLSLNTVPVITLQRTGCFGDCPIYKVAIYDDGRVAYEGVEFVKRKGQAKGQITTEALQELVREFEKIDYFNLEDNYGGDSRLCPESWTDYPSATTSLNWKDKKKTVRHYHGCRGSALLDQLTALEDKIDKAVNTKRWIG
ncbi:MAG TPA: DUF6438 domain-containing protein [Pyrinomonadaceae bacterium]|nr:DUF6438 domain-containing protein [Pyrinomonadaceae bacterium]